MSRATRPPRARCFWLAAALVAGCSSGGAGAGPPDPEASVADIGGDARAADDAMGEAGSEAPPVASTCLPGSIAGFTPPGHLAPPARSMACAGFGGDAGLVRAYGDACLGQDMDLASCGSFPAPDAGPAADCFGCLVTAEQPDAASYGAVVVAVEPVVNYAACVQLVDPTPAGDDCAQALYAVAACAEYACKAECPVVDDASMRAFLACRDNEAPRGPCVGYALTASACLDMEKGDGGTPVSQICFAGTSAEDHFLSAGRYFCGAD